MAARARQRARADSQTDRGPARRPRRGALPRTSPTRAADHDRDGSYPFEAIEALKARRLLRGAGPGGARRARRHVGPRRGGRLEPPRPRRRVGGDRREHAPRRGAEHRAPLADRGRRRQRAACRGVRRLDGARSPATASVMAAAISEPGQDLTRPGDDRDPHRVGLAHQRPQDLLHDVARGDRPLHGRHFADEDGGERYGYAHGPDRRAGRHRARRLGRDGHARLGQQLGHVRRTSSCPRPRCAAAFRSATRCPTWSGTSPPASSTPSASLGHRRVRRRDVARDERRAGRPTATRARGCSPPRTRWTSPPARAVLARPATLIDEHYAANPASDGTRRGARRAVRRGPGRQGVHQRGRDPRRRPRARALGRRRLPQRQPARARLPRRPRRRLHAPARRQPRLRLPRPGRPRPRAGAALTVAGAATPPRAPPSIRACSVTRSAVSDGRGPRHGRSRTAYPRDSSSTRSAPSRSSRPWCPSVPRARRSPGRACVRRGASPSTSWAPARAFARRATPAGADRFVGLDWEPGRGGDRCSPTPSPLSMRHHRRAPRRRSLDCRRTSPQHPHVAPR